MGFRYVRYVEYQKILFPYSFISIIQDLKVETSFQKQQIFLFSANIEIYEVYEKMFYTKVLWYFILFIMVTFFLNIKIK